MLDIGKINILKKGVHVVTINVPGVPLLYCCSSIEFAALRWAAATFMSTGVVQFSEYVVGLAYCRGFELTTLLGYSLPAPRRGAISLIRMGQEDVRKGMQG